MTEPTSILMAWRERAGIDRGKFARMADLSEMELEHVETGGVFALTPQTESAIEAMFFAESDLSARFLASRYLGASKLLNRMDGAFRDATRAMIRRQELHAA